jgi:hypothetical protein
MISDVLSEALDEIDRYLNDPKFGYDKNNPYIAKCRAAMWDCMVSYEEKVPYDLKLEKQKDHLGEAIWKLLEATELPWSDVCDVLQSLQQWSPAEWKALEEERDSASELND